MQWLKSDKCNNVNTILHNINFFWFMIILIISTTQASVQHCLYKEALCGIVTKKCLCNVTGSFFNVTRSIFTRLCVIQMWLHQGKKTSDSHPLQPGRGPPTRVWESCGSQIEGWNPADSLLLQWPAQTTRGNNSAFRRGGLWFSKNMK